MPVGYVLDGAGSGIGNRPPDLDGLRDSWDRLADWGRDRLDPVWDWVDRVVHVATWILEHVAEVYPVQHYAWITASDERVCPECGPLMGTTWPETTAHVAPPLHTNCRCQIAPAFIEWRTRWVASWRLVWLPEQIWEWKVTRWE